MLLAMAAAGVQAQNPQKILRQTRENGWEFDLKAGINIGGFSPLPLPVEIRSIDSYNPTLAVQLGVDITKWIDSSRTWGVSTGLRFENKNMTTRATVKNYGMEIIGGDGNRMKGNWTGGVRTKVQNTYLTLPVLASWKKHHHAGVCMPVHTSRTCWTELSPEMSMTDTSAKETRPAIKSTLPTEP